jgi:drug/metabolite transporter (DMT)-like permease
MINVNELSFILLALVGAIAYGLSAVIESYLSNQKFKSLSTLLFIFLLISPIFIIFLLPFGFLTLPSASTLPAYLVLGVLYLLLPLLIFFARRQDDSVINYFVR